MKWAIYRQIGTVKDKKKDAVITIFNSKQAAINRLEDIVDDYETSIYYVDTYDENDFIENLNE